MGRTVAILDDDPARLDAMVAIVRTAHPKMDVITFDNAPDLNVWLESKLRSCILICLDHDLGPNRERDGRLFDPGTGRDTAAYLATCEAWCPVLIHTTNIAARPGMISILEEAGWRVSYVSPYEDTLWIREVWADELAVLLPS